MSRAVPLTLLASLALALGACGSSDDDKTPETAAAPAATSAASTAGISAECAKDQLALKSPGTLTVGTDKPAYPPYFEDEDPTNGKGFESAFAYAVADALGFARDEVKWVTVPFNASYAPGKKKFDFDVNQISITADRSKVVDFSEPYYTAAQAVVVPKGSTLAPTGLADLKDATIGVQIGTTSLDAVDRFIAPTDRAQVFDNSNDVVTALKQSRVDAVVVDLPTAFYLTAAQVEGAKIVGQFNAPGGDEWGALFEKGSKLTPCVNQAIAELKKSGALDRITQQWMGEAAGAPKLG